MRLGSTVPASGRRFDAIIIGGGISGVAIAKACAQGGLRVLLLEQSDFGAGTSSRSTRIIHGGLRYLEHGELGLVRESLRERERLRVEKPHLVRPMRFLLAFSESTPALSLRNPIAIRLGLWLYKRMAGAQSNGTHPEALAESLEGFRVFDYEDAQCEFPERLIAEWLTEAISAGASVRNHSEVLEITRLHGKVTGVLARDAMTGEEYRLESSNVVNATGPWVDQVCAASNVGRERLIGGVRGSHIVLPRFAGAPEAAVYTEAIDGRPFFVIPWNEQILVGTTEVPDCGDPASSQASGEEVDYLLHSFQKVFPASQLRREDIHYFFSGVRPLPRCESDELGAISRKYFLKDHKDDGVAGLISVIGGKLTTAAALGRHCARKLGANAAEPPLAVVARGPANGYEGTLAHWAKQVSEATRNCRGVVPMESARAIAEWHGRHALGIVRRACQHPLLTQRLCEHSAHIVGEAAHAVEFEKAQTLGDILLRRVPVALSGCWDESCAQNAAQRIGKALGWNVQEVGRQLEALTEERGRFLQDPLELRDGSGHTTVPRKDVA
ncbi:MAG TPA: glycerol-3-phosphate dehydrogenase/oxidase [Terriglobales bacterium]|nr:glycerol-3-phosphate dehydrogenase/oxidase [Terriglobales bacterium]